MGRTGRFGDKGIAINLIEENKDLDLIHKIEEYYQNSIETLEENGLEKVNEILQKIGEENSTKRKRLEENI